MFFVVPAPVQSVSDVRVVPARQQHITQVFASVLTHVQPKATL